jgi:hypothetical protein
VSWTGTTLWSQEPKWTLKPLLLQLLLLLLLL